MEETNGCEATSREGKESQINTEEALYVTLSKANDASAHINIEKGKLASEWVEDRTEKEKETRKTQKRTQFPCVPR